SSDLAAKMEQGILKIEGVKDATVSFLAQKLTIECDEEKIDEIIKKAIKVCKKVDSDCEVIVK
ncbi:MAG: heavy-metal-associated domain-containing protein, partial [Ruminococcaceae bacterium]|nr:heavy-metal-associated domain-containing protein [Oscillospiraceae bacterium]